MSKGNFGLSIWGATTFNNSYSEIDLILNYNILPYLNIAFYDYFNPVPNSENHFRSYTGGKMRHTLELTADLEDDAFPLTLLTGVFIYGDKDSVSDSQRFSAYIEPGYNFTIAQKEFLSGAFLLLFLSTTSNNLKVILRKSQKGCYPTVDYWCIYFIDSCTVSRFDFKFFGTC